MHIEIGSYEAKTKLPELLRGVQAGHRYTITVRGHAVAELVPPAADPHLDAAAAVADMEAFMRAGPPVTVDLKSLINEGRA